MVLELKPVFVQNRNVRNFCDVMEGVKRTAGEGRFAVIYGRAGRGKTRTAQRHHGINGGIYRRILTIWNTSVTAFLQGIARELGIKAPPPHKDRCFSEILERLIDDPQPIYLDEIEKLPTVILGTLRDLTDLSTAPIIMIGEEELYDWMARDRRVWSRTVEVMEFQPVTASDIIFFAREAAEIQLPEEVAGILHQSSGGDFRIVKRDLGTLLRIANAKNPDGGPDAITPDMARLAVKAGIKGK